ncbi:alpha/beta fold hydrolase [Lysobacter sp. H21R4]|uniref:alpha/beta hydrolase n=1 Tax=Lysobacter sp. H21R4 TaxID=2781021 RepID=UPI001888CA62|nr:alpha/beta hydrolase [Lysobacter sp. H21R4]QOY62749.1 alpha/beta fold hydrolase [Lysobacter sp. H21R4]
MPYTASLIAAAVLAAALAGCQPADGPATLSRAGEPLAGTHPFGSIDFAPCSLTSAEGGTATEAHCGQLEVAEDPAHPDGRRISLNIAWLQPSNAGAPDPVFFLAGGPGQAATAHAAAVKRMLSAVGKQRDIILVDQRGTGRSHPLDCRGPDGAPLPLDVMAEQSQADTLTYTRQCLQGLEGRADPRFYTTTDAVRDLDAVRAALGVEKINLVGVSYGTRVAQQYAARYPAHTRSVVLDGVAPNELVVGGEFATTVEDALGLQSAQCRQIEACAKRYPVDMREQLRTVMQTLRQSPVEVDYRDSRTNQARHGTITADAVGSLAFMFSYLPQTASLLPLTIDEAAHGRYAPLMSLVQMSSDQMQGQINRGMNWSVVCAEDAGRYVPAPGAADTIMGSGLSEAFFAPCAQWPRGEVPADFHRPFTSEVPVLLLSGELDPVTPPRYGEQVAAHLPNARHLVLKGQGHNVAFVGCMPKLLGQFVETADAKALDATCLDNLSYVPPFVNFNGWSP